MKKTIITILGAFLIGGICSYFYLDKLVDSLSYLDVTKSTVYAYQIGVYQSYENALEVSEENSNSIVISDDGLYRVIINIVHDESVKKLLDAYYKENNISVYTKEITVSANFLSELEIYEKAYLNADSSVYDKLSQEVLNAYLEVL